MAYAFGHISGGHFNPAVTLGAWLCKRVETRAVVPYAGHPGRGGHRGGSRAAGGRERPTGLQPCRRRAGGQRLRVATPPGHYNLVAVPADRRVVVLTAFFLLVISRCATDRRAPKGFGPLAIGLSLTLIHLVSIPVTNTSVNPARSTGPALLVGEGWAVGQLWLFWLAPLLGAALAGLGYRYVTGDSGIEDLAEAAQAPLPGQPTIGEAQAP